MALIKDPRTGKVYIRTIDGKLIEVKDPKLSDVDPGFARRYVPGKVVSPSAEQAEMLSRLPAADVAGFAPGSMGVVRGGEQAAGARRVDSETGGQAPPPPTYRPLGGARLGNRGGSVVASVGGSASPELLATVVQSASDAGNDSEAICVTLGVEVVDGQQDDLTTSWDVAPVAEITWGSGNATFSASVDWQSGTTIVLPASSVRIGVRVPAGDPTGPVIAPVQMAFSAALSYGASVGKPVATARLTQRTATITAGATGAKLVVPSFAQSFTIVSASLAPSWIARVYRGSSVIATYQMTSNTNAANQGEWSFPLPNGSRFVELTNNCPTDEIGTVIYTLGL